MVSVLGVANGVADGDSAAVDGAAAAVAVVVVAIAVAAFDAVVATAFLVVGRNSWW